MTEPSGSPQSAHETAGSTKRTASCPHDVNGLTADDLDDLEDFLRDNAPLIFELAEAPYDKRLTGEAIV